MATTTFPTTKENGKKVLLVQDKKARSTAEDILFALEELKQILLDSK